MKANLVENSTLALTTLIFGIMAGFFWTYSFNVNYAMQQIDGTTYAKMQSLFNQNVRHFIFFIFFFGGGLVSAITLLANFKQRKTLCFWLLALASLIYILGVIVFTAKVNLPLNYYTESWDINKLPTDWHTTREQWNSANLFRVFTSFSSFILCLIIFVIRSSKK